MTNKKYKDQKLATKIFVAIIAQIFLILYIILLIAMPLLLTALTQVTAGIPLIGAILFTVGNFVGVPIILITTVILWILLGLILLTNALLGTVVIINTNYEKKGTGFLDFLMGLIFPGVFMAKIDSAILQDIFRKHPKKKK
jgi:hypothetical protein